MPINSGSFDPYRPPIQPETGPATSMTRAEGSMNRPAAVTVAPKPKPALVGTWTNWGIRMNEPNIPKPTSSAVMLVVRTGRRRIIRMSTSGSGWRISKPIQASVKAIASTITPIVVGDVQPQVSPSLTAMSRATRPPVNRAAPPQSTLAGLLTGDSGMNRWVAITAGIATIRPSQKIHS